MKNLAGDRTCDETIRTELEEAGINVVGYGMGGEVPYTLTGEFAGWMFTRAWYYWVASAPKSSAGLPFELAKAMHHKMSPEKNRQGDCVNYGQLIRVDGHCGCPSPEGGDGYRDAGSTMPVRCYHIDTQSGLNYFAQVLRTGKVE